MMIALSIKISTMPKKHKKDAEKAGSEKAVSSKENQPINENTGAKTGERKIIGIGMPVSGKKMEQLKKEAEKPDC